MQSISTRKRQHYITNLKVTDDDNVVKYLEEGMNLGIYYLRFKYNLSVSLTNPMIVRLCLETSHKTLEHLPIRLSQGYHIS